MSENENICLEGNLTVSRAGEVAARIREGLEGAAGVVLDLEGAEEIDITLLQLVCAAFFSAQKNGKTFKIKTNAVVEDGIKSAGFSMAEILAGS